MPMSFMQNSLLKSSTAMIRFHSLSIIISLGKQLEVIKFMLNLQFVSSRYAFDNVFNSNLWVWTICGFDFLFVNNNCDSIHSTTNRSDRNLLYAKILFL